MLHQFATLSLKLSGWKKWGTPPDIPKYVFIAAPHTSNWDGVLLLFYAHAFNINMHFMIKDSWTKSSIGWLLRYFNAVGIDRSRSGNMVEAMAKEFRERDSFVLAIPPEGTRAKRDFWKSGFYHIAHHAQVPIVIGLLDYKNKRAGFGPVVELSGDKKADMDRIRSIYEEIDFEGRSHADYTEPLLRGEAEEQ